MNLEEWAALKWTHEPTLHAHSYEGDLMLYAMRHMLEPNLDPPDPGPTPRERVRCDGCLRHVWRWHSVEGDTLCDACLPRPLPNQFPKRCTCCKHGLSRTHLDWCALPLVGYMAEDELAIELRNCGCGTTLAIEVDLTRCAAEGARERMMYR